MKKFALMTALVTASSFAVPAMADNSHWRNNNGNASDHKYVKYNNGNAYGKYKPKHGGQPYRYASQRYTVKQPAPRHHAAPYAHKKWPVPTRPSSRPNHNPMPHSMPNGHYR